MARCGPLSIAGILNFHLPRQLMSPLLFWGGSLHHPQQTDTRSPQGTARLRNFSPHKWLFRPRDLKRCHHCRPRSVKMSKCQNCHLQPRARISLTKSNVSSSSRDAIKDIILVLSCPPRETAKRMKSKLSTFAAASQVRLSVK